MVGIATQADGPFRAAIRALSCHRPAEAVPLLQQAIAIGDGGPLAVLNLGMALADLGRHSDAVPLLRQAADALPQMAEPRFRLGNIAGLRGAAEEAEAEYRAVLGLDPFHVPGLAALAVLLEGSGRLDEAAAIVARARSLEPDEPELWLASGRLALARNEAEAAAAEAAALLRQRPHHVRAARLLAEALVVSQGENGALRQIAEGAAADPFAAGWPMAAAVVLEARGDRDAALAELRTAEVLAPQAPGVVAELGKMLATCGQHAEANVMLRRAIALQPNDPDLYNRLATVLHKGQRIGEMLALLDNAIAEFGANPTLLVNRSLALNNQGRQQEALESADAAVAQGGGVAALMQRMNVLPYHAELGHAAAVLENGRAINARLPRPPAPLHPHRRDPDRRLRIGLLSGCFGVHPVGWLTLGGLEALPADAFEIATYSLKPRQDTLSGRFRARSALWRDVGTLPDAGIAATIQADAVDILIDLGGYGDGGRPSVLMHKPAPVQIKWVGAQFGTTGLDTLDWMLTDRWETPLGFERFYAERLLRMPDGYVCYTPPHYAPAVGPLPALANGHVTFGCFNNLAKLTPRVLAAWSRILAAVPGSRLVIRTHALRDEATRAVTEQRMLEAGLPLDRIELLGGCPHGELLADYNRIDIALDPFPYAGGLTACEALYMGVPLVGLGGDTFASRHAFSHCSNVGLGEWVAWSEEAYVAQAVARARDLGALAALRAGLRERVTASPLCDAPRFGQNLGQALRHAWREWCHS